ncbi:MAG: helix-turn-helix transcriptional regulator [Acidobacteriota bacterium]
MTASRETLATIRQDQRRVSPPIAALLVHIERHIFDATLNVNRLKEACGVRNNSVAIFFHIEVGQPPGAYIARSRLETAAKLLAHTELPIWRIADLVGYSGMPTFSRAFHRAYELRPRAYRKEQHAETRKLHEEEIPANQNVASETHQTAAVGW